MSYKTQHKHRGWVLAEVGHNYFCACKGSFRSPVGSIKRGDREDLTQRFKAVVDQLEGVNHGTED